MTTIQIPATNEVVSALLAKKYAADKALLAAVKSDPAKALNVRDAALKVRTVQNTAAVVHVCVPDYQAMRALESSDLEQISGGTATSADPMTALLVRVTQAYQEAFDVAICFIESDSRPAS